MDLEQYQQFICPLDEKVLVLCLDPAVDTFSFPESSKWYFDVSMFETSHAFAAWEDVPQPLILLDKRLFSTDWFSADHLFIILAHELGHIHFRSLDEEKCDEYALELLKKHGLTEAVKLFEIELENRAN